MSVTGDGTGGKSVTSTTAYQTLFNSTFTGGTDSGPVRAYCVRSTLEDAYVKVTFQNNDTPRIYNAIAGVDLPIVVPPSAGKIAKVEVKGETGIGVIYGNIIVA